MDSYLRTATEEDMDLLFQWANDPTVRKNSFSSQKIPYQDHCRWYKELLKRADCRQYIYIYHNENVGQARITISGEAAEISYSICREKRCLGHGKKLLQLLRNQIKEDFPDIRKLVAKVKPDNIASQQVFLDMGYTEKFLCFELSLEHVSDSKCSSSQDNPPGGGYYS